MECLNLGLGELRQEDGHKSESSLNIKWGFGQPGLHSETLSENLAGVGIAANQTIHIRSKSLTNVSCFKSHAFSFSEKGFPCEPWITQSVVKSVGCFPQTVSEALLLKTIPTQLIEEAATYIEPSPYVPESLSVEGTWQATKEKCEHKPSYKLFDPQRCPACKIL